MAFASADACRGRRVFFDSESSTVSISLEDDSCRRRTWRSRPRPRKRTCRRCLNAFNQVEFLLASADPIDQAKISDSFKSVKGKLDAVITSNELSFASGLDSESTELKKKLTGCAQGGINKTVTRSSGNTSMDLDYYLTRTKDIVDSVVKEVLNSIAMLGQQPDASIVAQVTLPTSTFRVFLDTAISSVLPQEKQEILRIVNRIKQETVPTIAVGVQSISSCLQISFKSFYHSSFALLKSLNSRVVKEIGEVCSAGTTSLNTVLSQFNKRLAESVRFVLKSCIDSLFGRGYDDVIVSLPFLFTDRQAVST